MSPTTKTSGWPGRVRSSWTSMRPARSSAAPVWSASCAPERRGADAGGPHLAHGLDALAPAVGVLDLDAGRVDVDDLGAEAHLDAHVGQALDGAVAELLAERAEHRRGGVEQDDARLGRVDAAEVALEGAPGELGDLAGHLDAGRARADDDERHEPVDLGLGRRELGELERAEDAAPQLEGVVDRLHARGVPRELVVAEAGLAGAGGDDERVVGRDGLAPDGGVRHGARREVDRPSRRRAAPWRCAGGAAPRASRGRSRPRRGCRSPPGRATAGRGGGSCGR